MAKLPAPPLQELAARASEVGLPAAFKETYDHMLIRTGKKIWRGMLAVASGGFGKGILITAAIIIGAAALLTGYDNYAFNSPFEDGLIKGVSKGIAFLTSNFGIATAAFGGVMGAISDVRKEQNKIAAELACAQSKEFALGQQLKQASVSLSPERPIEKPWEHPLDNAGFIAREEERRAQMRQNQGRVLQ